jgi:dihydroneopterin aldolase
MLVLEEFPVTWVALTLSKPGAVRGSREVGVAITRDRSALDGWRPVIRTR